MLLTLSLRDFVLVDRLDLEFDGGFSVLTGETGAGKSILLDALSLVLGARGDAGVVRSGCERAEISAIFQIDTVAGLSAWLAENGLEGDEGQCLLRRNIDAGGRSRAFVNGQAATLVQLKAIGEFLVDIHGQHAHYSLLKAGEQRRILDAYAGQQALAAQLAEAFHAWRKLVRDLTQAESHAAEAGAEQDELRWRLDSLDGLEFSAEEWLALQDSHRRLAHAAELIQGAQGIASALDEDESGALARLHAVHTQLQGLVEIDPNLAGSLEMVEAALVQLQEAARELNHYGSRVDLDPQALAEAEARLARINDTARKFRVRPEALPELLDATRARLDELARLTDPAGLRQAVEAAEARYMKLAGQLSAQRQQAARRLAKDVSAAMQRLAMQGGAFEVSLEACAPEAGGLEGIEFLVSPHSGQSARSLAKTASGGELSRIGLALQTILSGLSGAPTLIFDEVDAGIGGGIAEIVGRMLAELGETRQVLCVTHLPQVAAGAAHHWQVSKRRRDDGQAVSQVASLDRPQRVEELARMLGGVKITETTRKHAAEMLGAL
jgi:DNA repair protein RecN (Recombination protein N)